LEVTMNGSHVAGAGFGAIVGAILVSLGGRIGLDLTSYDAATLGMGALAVGLAVGHAIGEVGLVGIGRVILHGRQKPAAAVVVQKPAVVAPVVPVAPPPAPSA
jgi:hypothetical protein